MLQLRAIASRFMEVKNEVEVWKFAGCKYSTVQVWREIGPNKERVAIPEHIIIVYCLDGHSEKIVNYG